MKNTLFALLLLTSVVTFGQSQKNYYCIQVTSTENPHLLKKDYFSILPFDTAYCEIAIINDKVMYRVMFVYEDKDQQKLFFHLWKMDFPDALMVTRKECEYNEMFKLFEDLKI
jgi:hypothetical protein